MRDEPSGMGAGILLVTVGLLFMADRQGWVSFVHLWPVILIVLGVVMLVFPKDAVGDVGATSGRRGAIRGRRSRASGGIWLIFVGGLLLANQNHWLLFRDSWPLFIVAGGLAMIAGNINRRPRSGTEPEATSPVGESGTDGAGGGSWR